MGLLLLAAAAGVVATVHHVEHGLRPEGTHEADLVASAARERGFAFVAHTVEVGAGANLEARARAARRGVLPGGALTGHTMDDQAETVLLNLLRGAAGDGLGAMSSRTKPLLGVRRREVRAFVEASGVPYAVDASNFDLSRRRNLVRARLLPELSRAVRRDLVPVLARQASVLRDEAAFLDESARRAVPDALDVGALRAAPAVLRRRRLRDLVREHDPEGHPPSASEIDRMEQVVAGSCVATELPGGLRIARRQGRLLVERG